MLIITQPNSAESFLVANNDFDLLMDLEQANHGCNELENGWRLPSKVELELMYKNLHLNGLGSFQSNFYWTCTVGREEFYWVLDFNSGVFAMTTELSMHNTRAVRTI